jgi:hypothetical protein
MYGKLVFTRAMSSGLELVKLLIEVSLWVRGMTLRTTCGSQQKLKQQQEALLSPVFAYR